MQICKSSRTWSRPSLVKEPKAHNLGMQERMRIEFLPSLQLQITDFDIFQRETANEQGLGILSWVTVISEVEQKFNSETLRPKKSVILEGRDTWWTRSTWDGKLVGAWPCCCGAWNWALSSPLFSNDKFNVLCLQTQTSISQSLLSDPFMCWQRVKTC